MIYVANNWVKAALFIYTLALGGSLIYISWLQEQREKANTRARYWRDIARGEANNSVNVDLPRAERIKRAEKSYGPE